MDASPSDLVAKSHAPRRRIWLLVAVPAALLLLYTLVGFLLVPALARRALTSYVARLPGVQLTVDDIAFNPFTLTARLSGLSLRGPDAAQLAGFRSLQVVISPASLFERGYTLRQIALVAPALNVRIAPDGRLNLRVLQAPPASGSAAAAGSTPVRIGQLSLAGGSVHFEDHSRATAFVTTLTPISFSLSNFQTQGAGDGHFALHAHAQSGEALDLTGMLGMQPLSSSGQFQLQSLQTSTISAYLGSALPVALRSGEAGLSGSYRFATAAQDILSVQLSEVQVNSLAVADRSSPAAAPWLTVPQLTLANVDIELPRRQVSIGSLALKQTHVIAALEPDGTLSLQHMLGATSGASAREPASAAPASAASSSPAWSISLSKFSLEAARLSLADRSVTPAVELEVGPLQLTAQGYSTSGAQPVSFDVSTDIDHGGHLATQGSLRLAPLSGSLSMNLQHLDLTLLQPYISQRTSLSLYRGNLGVQGMLMLGAQGSAGAAASARTSATPDLQVQAQIDLSDFATRDQITNTELVSARSVQVLDLHYQRHPDQLRIGTVRARGLYGRVVIGSNGNLNLSSLLRKSATTAATPTAAPTPSQTDGQTVAASDAQRRTRSVAPARAATGGRASSASATAGSMPISIGKVQLIGSTANFTDRSVQPNFSAGIEELKGTITGLSSEPASRARVQLTGAVNRYAPVSIDGEVNVLSAQTFTDITLSFQNIDLPLFNPYSGKFAGYSIAQGKLTTLLHYHVENQRLNATHHVVIDQLEFGPATATKPAVPLPIRLAAALLKDRNGVITLDLPVSGTLSDPSFRIAPIVWKLFVGLVRHIVTAPFSWLGSVLGGDGSKLAYVDFAPGSAALDDASTHKLAQLAQALAQRPQLRLDVPLHTVSESDDRALEQQALDAAVGALTASGAPDAARPAAGESAAATSLRRFVALATLYRRQFRAAPLFPPDATTPEERQKWLEQQLLAQYAPHRAQRDALGLARATATQMAVLAGGKVAATRVFLTQRATGGASSAAVRMELQLQ